MKVFIVVDYFGLSIPEVLGCFKTKEEAKIFEAKDVEEKNLSGRVSYHIQEIDFSNDETIP